MKTLAAFLFGAAFMCKPRASYNLFRDQTKRAAINTTERMPRSMLTLACAACWRKGRRFLSWEFAARFQVRFCGAIDR